MLGQSSYVAVIRDRQPDRHGKGNVGRRARNVQNLPGTLPRTLPRTLALRARGEVSTASCTCSPPRMVRPPLHPVSRSAASSSTPINSALRAAPQACDELADVAWSLDGAEGGELGGLDVIDA